METEIWKPVVGYEGKYEVSNLAKVKSLNYLRTGKEKILLNSKSREKGYVSFHTNRIKKTFLVSRLVAIAFIPNPNNLPCVCHKDETLDNRGMLSDVENNLFWGTYKDNTQDMIKKGRRGIIKPMSWKGKFGSDHNRSKKVNQYSIDGTFIRSWDSMSMVQGEIQIGFRQVSACCIGKTKTAGGFIWKYK